MKIRVWDLKEKCWIGRLDFINHLVRTTQKNEIQLALDFEGNENYKVCLATGLRDLNNEEIYEGDIVKCSRYEYGQKEPLVMKIHVRTLTNLADEINNGLDTWVSYEDIIIIGNVFEHSELLEKK